MMRTEQKFLTSFTVLQETLATQLLKPCSETDFDTEQTVIVNFRDGRRTLYKRSPFEPINALLTLKEAEITYSLIQERTIKIQFELENLINRFERLQVKADYCQSLKACYEVTGEFIESHYGAISTRLLYNLEALARFYGFNLNNHIIKRGVCYGLNACMIVQFLYKNLFDTFDILFSLSHFKPYTLNGRNYYSIVDLLSNASAFYLSLPEATRHTSDSLNRDHKELVEILNYRAIFEQIILFQYPRDTALYEITTVQDILAITSMLYLKSPIKEERGGIIIQDLQGLTSYFHDIFSLEYRKNTAYLLTNASHTIVILETLIPEIHSEKILILFDQNIYDYHKSYKLRYKIEELSIAVMDTFEQENKKTCVFSINAYHIKTEEPKDYTRIKNLKTLTLASTEKSRKKSTTSLQLALELAIEQKHKEQVDFFLKTLTLKSQKIDLFSTSLCAAKHNDLITLKKVMTIDKELLNRPYGDKATISEQRKHCTGEFVLLAAYDFNRPSILKYAYDLYKFSWGHCWNEPEFSTVPIIMASKRGFSNIVKCLLPTAGQSYWQSHRPIIQACFNTACQYGHSKTVDELLTYFRHDLLSLDLTSALKYACSNGYTSIVMAILKEIHETITCKGELLRLACHGKHRGVCQVILDTYSTDCFDIDPAGYSALSIAASENHHKLAAMLEKLEPAMLRSKMTSSPQSPLLCAIRQGHIAMARFLLSHGYSTQGMRALVLACKSAVNPDLVQLLIHQALCDQIDIASYQNPAGQSLLTITKAGYPSQRRTVVTGMVVNALKDL